MPPRSAHDRRTQGQEAGTPHARHGRLPRNSRLVVAAGTGLAVLGLATAGTVLVVNDGERRAPEAGAGAGAGQAPQTSDAVATGRAPRASAATGQPSVTAARSSAGAGAAPSAGRQLRGPWKTAGSGQLTFSVRRVRYDLGGIGQGEGARPGDGSRFVAVDLSVRNTGGRALLIPHDEQRLRDAEGRTYRPDVAAEAGVSTNQLLVPVKANSTSTGVLIFKVPISARPDVIRLTATTSASSTSIRL